MVLQLHFLILLYFKAELYKSSVLLKKFIAVERMKKVEETVIFKFINTFILKVNIRKQLSRIKV